MRLVSQSGKHTGRGGVAVIDDKKARKPKASHLSTKKKKYTKKQKRVRRLVKAGAALVIVAALYCMAVFSNIPFIEKWRTLYIETAMSTMTHQWLATALIPKSVIDKVMEVRYQMSEEQYDVESSWGDESGDNPGGSVSISTVGGGSGASLVQNTNASSVDDIDKQSFLDLFDEIDVETLDAYVADNPDVIAGGWKSFKVNEAGLEQNGTSIYTIQGEQVLAVDAPNGILIVREKSDTYKGVLAIVKDPSMLSVYNATSLGEVGQFSHDIAQRTDALIVMGANGFEDTDGVGNGGTIYGLSIASGVKAGTQGSGNFKRVEIRNDDRMYIVSSYYDVDPDTRDAAEFYPALIVDGQCLIDGSYSGWGTQPRQIIAQSEDKEILMLVVEGRQGINNLGITLNEACDILQSHNAYQAMNMDGGSTAIMCYEGEPITMCSNGYIYGRTLPNAFIIKAKD